MAIDSAKLRQKIESIESLPTLPVVVTKILEVTRNPKADATAVGKILSNDQALTGKILKLVNSAFYGFPGKIKTITHAIVILGFNKVKNIAIATSVFDIAKGSKSASSFDLPKFWEHALGTAITCRTISKLLKIGDMEEAFVCGLLHDIGKIILFKYLRPLFDKIIEIRNKKDCLLLEAERELMGFDHARIGTWIVERWKLPEIIQNSVRYHHMPENIRGNKEFPYIVHLADILTRGINIGNGGDTRIPALHPIVWKDLNLNINLIDRICAQVIEETQKAQAFFDLIESS